ncbi:MAG: hypothetical protein A2Y40_03355 [Candidatus Margulisbacteria bacterium GWF2_35_9]|nr:MAG: hypothetical protein A2Y40_03355 [Candidatus Margulisbacteria bacterium GWF2_35_9]
MNIGILCSGVALGVYIPGLYIHRDLHLHAMSSEVFVLENLLYDDKINKIADSKKLFHTNFRAALVGQKLAKDMSHNIDSSKTTKQFNYWLNENVNYFIVLSGFWMPLLEEFNKIYPDYPIEIECLHIDSCLSPSWEKVNHLVGDTRSTWLMRADKNKILYNLEITKELPISFSYRANELLLHGGGWGIGTYQDKISSLLEHNYHLNIVAYYPQEADFNHTNIRYYGIDPDWSPWQKDISGEYTFPPFSEIENGKTPVYKNNTQIPELFNISRSVKGIVSKPGGSTLLDSLQSATPIILLEGFGKHEEENAALWQELGYGIRYDDWKNNNFDVNILENLHLNLLSEQGAYPKYIDMLLSKFTKINEENLS